MFYNFFEVTAYDRMRFEKGIRFYLEHVPV